MKKMSCLKERLFHTDQCIGTGKYISISKHPCFVGLKFRPLPTRLPHYNVKAADAN